MGDSGENQKARKVYPSLYLLPMIQPYSILIRRPRILACSSVIILARRSSLISSRRPSKPALKNTCKQVNTEHPSQSAVVVEIWVGE